MKIPKVINTKVTNHNLKKGKNVINHLGIKMDNNKKLVTYIGRYTLKATQLQEAHYQSQANTYRILNQALPKQSRRQQETEKQKEIYDIITKLGEYL